MNENDATDLVTTLFECWYIPLISYALRTTANYELAEDLVQTRSCSSIKRRELSNALNTQRLGQFAFFAER